MRPVRDVGFFAHGLPPPYHAEVLWGATTRRLAMQRQPSGNPLHPNMPRAATVFPDPARGAEKSVNEPQRTMDLTPDPAAEPPAVLEPPNAATPPPAAF